MNKWDLIVQYLTLHSFPEEVITLASIIRRVLINLYDNEIEVPITLESDDDLISLVYEDKYCIACVTHNNNCWACEFGRMTGLCDDDSSLFGLFTHELMEALGYDE